jgi:hypothetical protein
MLCPDCKAEINIEDKLDACDDCGYNLTYENDDNELIKINKLYEINSEINKIEILYEKIIVLKCQIDNTNQFNYKSIEMRKEYIKAKDELDKIRKELNNTDNMINYKIKQKYLDMKELEFYNMQREILYLHDNNINNVYNRIINNDCSDIDIKLYKLIIFNLEKKAELKELLKDYYNEENVKLILSELYEKKIKLLVMD